MSEIETRVAEAKSKLAEQAPAGVQRRVVPLTDVEVRAADDGFTVTGHAAVFDKLSDDLGGFREQIKRGAFKKVLGDDVRFLVNHNPDLLLARSTNGTLRLKEDPTGLAIEADIAPTTAGNDLRVLLERGDMDQMSFAFSMQGGSDTWDENPDTGELIRTINRFGALFDASAVTYPAYPQTDIQANSNTHAATVAEVVVEPVEVSPPSERTDPATPQERASEADGDAEVETPHLAYRQRWLRMRERELSL